mmetsp:Transcript_10256/g.22191  ORF Transcript_10256/g.22191 Transcript_10256/m.22191 type:complete len:755 (-) Transcript_10256:213-2477(-)
MVDRDNLFDSSIILINSDEDDDDSSCSLVDHVASSRANAAHPTSFGKNHNEGEEVVNASIHSSCASLSSSSSAGGGGSNKHDVIDCVDPKKAGGSIVDIDACDNDEDDDSHSSSSSSSGIPSPWKLKSATKSNKKQTTNTREDDDDDGPPSVIHTQSPKAPANAAKGKAKTGNTKPAKKKCLTNSNKQISKEEEDSIMSMATTSSSLLTKQSMSNSNCAPDSIEKENSEENEKNTNDGANETTTKKPRAKQQRKPKKRQWGYNNKKRNASKSKSASTEATPTASTKAATAATDTSSIASIPSSVQLSTSENINKHYHCYLLRSLDPSHPLKTYIGFTTHPQRRIRQHNGILKSGGARRTKRSGRPWTFVCVIHGFQDKITALQFEWAWQHVDKCKSFREAVTPVGDEASVGDALARKMKRRYGPKARLDELRILLKDCMPFCLYSLTVYFPEREYHDMFRGMVVRGKNGNPYKKDEDESTCYEDSLMNMEVCALEDMPVAREMREAKEKKVAEKEALREAKQKEKGGEKTNLKTGQGTGKKEDDDASDISSWIESVKSTLEEASCFSDLDDDNEEEEEDLESNCGNLKTIAETNVNSSFDIGDDSSIDDDNDDDLESHHRNGIQNNNNSSNNDTTMDDISKDFLSLSIKKPKKKSNLTSKKNYYREDEEEDCDFSTISSEEENASECNSLNNNIDRGTIDIMDITQQSEKENEQPSSDCESFSFAQSSSKASSSKKASSCAAKKWDIVDLCDSP